MIDICVERRNPTLDYHDHAAVHHLPRVRRGSFSGGIDDTWSGTPTVRDQAEAPARMRGFADHPPKPVPPVDDERQAFRICWSPTTGILQKISGCGLSIWDARINKSHEMERIGSKYGLDRLPTSPLTGLDGSPTHEVEGNNREHGADDPHGTKTVAAPATVSGLPSILVAHSAMPLCGQHGKADGQRIFVSQETCRHLSIHRHGRGSPEQEYAMKITSASRRRPTLPFPQPVDCSIVRTA